MKFKVGQKGFHVDCCGVYTITLTPDQLLIKQPNGDWIPGYGYASSDGKYFARTQENMEENFVVVDE